MKRNPVTPAVRDAVLRRDKVCFLYRLDDLHICRDVFGTPHAPYDAARLTLDHVKDQLRMGLRAPSDPGHLVAMCGAGNVGGPSKAIRAAQREYLRAVA